MSALDSLWRKNFALLEPSWEQVFGILGDTGTVLPLVGPGDDGQPNATSFKTRRRHASGLEAVFTWSKIPSTFDTGLDLTDPAKWQGIVPTVTFDGTDEEADSPDAAYWTRALAAASWAAWVNVNNTATNKTILAKYDTAGDTREWQFHVDDNEALAILLYDESESGNPLIRTYGGNTSVVPGEWHFVAATYDGSADATGLNLYVDDAVISSTDTDNAAFVSMENLGGTMKLAHTNASPHSFFDGSMAGGPFGPLFVQAELTAAQVKRLYNLGRAAMGLT